MLEGPEGVEQIHVAGPVQTNTAESLALAIRDGIGIGMLPLYSAIDALRDGTLVRVLPAHILQKMNVYALYPSPLRRCEGADLVEMLRVPGMIARDVEMLNAIDREPQPPERRARTSALPHCRRLLFKPIKRTQPRRACMTSFMRARRSPPLPRGLGRRARFRRRCAGVAVGGLRGLLFRETLS